MFRSVFDILHALPVYALVIFRIAGLVMTAPVFGSRVIPVRIRGALVILLAAMVFPVVASDAPTNVTFPMILAGAAPELLIGAGMGIALTVLLMGVEVAGHLVGQQAGLALGQVIDPAHNANVSTIGQVYLIVVTILFLMAGGHRALLAALLDTYAVIPLFAYQPGDSLLLLMIEMITSAFVLGIRVAAPVMIALFLVATALAVLSRTVPQLNILTVGFSFKVLVAMAAAGMALAAYEDVFIDALREGLETIRAAFGLDPSRLRLTS